MKKILVIFGTCMLLPLVLVSSEFIVKKQNIFTKDGKEMGVIYKGVKIDAKKDGFKLSGWVMDGNEYIIFYSQKDRIKLARISEEYIKNFKILKTKKDEFDVVWKRVELDFKLKNENHLTNNENNLWKKEQELYVRCGSCHQAHKVSEYTVNQWPPVIKSMQDNAGFTKKETKAVGRYMQFQAIKQGE